MKVELYDINEKRVDPPASVTIIAPDINGTAAILAEDGDSESAKEIMALKPRAYTSDEKEFGAALFVAFARSSRNRPRIVKGNK